MNTLIAVFLTFISTCSALSAEIKVFNQPQADGYRIRSTTQGWVEMSALIRSTPENAQNFCVSKGYSDSTIVEEKSCASMSPMQWEQGGEVTLPGDMTLTVNRRGKTKRKDVISVNSYFVDPSTGKVYGYLCIQSLECRK